jgi:hypothetical protein
MRKKSDWSSNQCCKGSISLSSGFTRQRYARALNTVEFFLTIRLDSAFLKRFRGAAAGLSELVRSSSCGRAGAKGAPKVALLPEHGQTA